MKQVLRSFALFLVLTFLAGFSWKDSTVVCPARGVLNSATENSGSDFALTDQNGKPHKPSADGEQLATGSDTATGGCRIKGNIS